MKRLLVIEDGSEYSDFARLYLGSAFEVRTARSAAEALRTLADCEVDAFLFDLRFDRAEPSMLVGDVEATARRLFAGDRGRALRHLQDQQGALILAELRAHGHRQPAVFVHDFPERRLANLRQLYGSVDAVASFDAQTIGALLSK